MNYFLHPYMIKLYSTIKKNSKFLKRTEETLEWQNQYSAGFVFLQTSVMKYILYIQQPK